MQLLDQKGRVQTVGALCLLHPNFPQKEQFIEVLDGICKEILEKHPQVSKDALKNTRGRWYQWLLGVSAWNWFNAHKQSYLAVSLPNISGFDLADLYEPRFKAFIQDLRAKVLSHASVELVTSNPDFVIVDVSALKLKLHLAKPILSFDPPTLESLDSLYLGLVGKCNFDNLIGYVSVKTTLRPDRRLQIPHEGSLMKAIYAHLQTRDWIINPRGLRYYAVASSVNPQDFKALRTVATHSITTVNEVPKAAVDDVFKINNESEARSVWKSILGAKV